MNLSFMHHLIDNEFIQAFCWTLIDSLWQGLVLAILAGAMVLLTKKASPQMRYTILSWLFYLFLAGSLATFYWQWHAAVESANLPSQESKWNTDHISMKLNVQQGVSSLFEQGNILNHVKVYLNNHAASLVCIWFMIFLANGIKFLIAFRQTRRIANHHVLKVDSIWSVKLAELSAKLNITKGVLLKESSLVKVPLMIGFLKPVILFPLGLISQLSVEEVEAVLLHELAHIMRMDYCSNLVQSLVEVIYFFNPGLRWVSSLIRREREICCDDIAIKTIQNKDQYIYALVAFQEYHISNSSLSIAFPGHRQELLNRINRIISNKNKSLNNMEKIMISAALIMLCFVSTTFSKAAPQNSHNVSKGIFLQKQVGSNGQQNPTNTDTLPANPNGKENGSKVHVKSTFDGKEYSFEVVDGKVVELYVNGQRITNDKLPNYQPILNQIQKQLTENEATLKEQAQVLKEEEVRMQKAQLDLEAQARIEATERLRQDAELSLQKQTQEALSIQDAQLAKQQRELALLAISNLQKDQFSKVLDEHREEERLMMNEDNIARLKENLEKLRANQEALNRPRFPISPFGVESIQPVGSIIEELLEERIIQTVEDLSFSLDSRQFIVNGIKQSESLHDRLKIEFLQDPKDHVIYSAKRGTIHTDVQVSKR
jgi:bla regulator protein blaR1